MTKRWNGLLVYDKEGSKRNASYIKMHEEVKYADSFFI